jgi:hypothetical protein
MACSSTGIGCSSPPSGCPDEYGCIGGLCPDFTIRRHDTKPAFKVKIEDCDGPLDLTDLVLEATMWAKGKIKVNLDQDDTVIGFADNIGFGQIMVGDVIIMNQARLPEKMLVLGFDEVNKLINVQRGYHGTPIQTWKRGTIVRIIKFSNAVATSEMVYQDIINIDGTTSKDVLVNSYFVYEWSSGDTCLPGCYYLEFKLLKMVVSLALSYDSSVPSNQIPSNLLPDGVIPSFTDPSFTPSNFGCSMNPLVEWIRRFPIDKEGFIIKITNTFTADD